MVKEKIAKRTVMMRENSWRFFFFRKVLLAYRCWFNLDALFLYSKENSNFIIWHLLASILAFIKHVLIQRGATGGPDPPPEKS